MARCRTEVALPSPAVAPLSHRCRSELHRIAPSFYGYAWDVSLQATAPVAGPEPPDRKVDATRERDHLEELAHFGGTQ